MASKEKKNSGDFVLESRHLVGLFLLLVVIFGVVFTLGYLLGRSQYDGSLRAAVGKPPLTDVPPSGMATKSKSKLKSESEARSVDTAPHQNDSDWDFYHAAESKPSEDHLQPVKKTVAVEQSPAIPRPASAPLKPAKTVTSPPAANSPIPPGAIMLQVAAVSTQGDALALAQALQEKKFPAYVITPAADKYYRVQVGPYTDKKSAAAARQDLEAKGFKSIVKR